jgi:hypothetical protein
MKKIMPFFLFGALMLAGCFENNNSQEPEVSENGQIQKTDSVVAKKESQGIEGDESGSVGPSIEVINKIYKKRPDGIYIDFETGKLGRVKISEADPDTFEPLVYPYSRDSEDVFYQEKKMQADVKTFEFLCGYDDPSASIVFKGEPLFNTVIAKDSVNVYKNSEVIEEANPENLLCLKGGLYQKDEANFYREGEVLSNVTPDKYEFLGDSYFKDSEKVYLLFLNRLTEIEEADQKSFSVLGNGYAKDSKRVFIADNTVEGADPKSFKPLNGWFGKDANGVYYRWEEVKNADPGTFRILSDERFLGQSLGFYSIDKESVFNYGDVISGADPETFEVLGEGYAKDSGNVYFSGEVISGADVDSFRIMEREKKTEKGDYYNAEDADNFYFGRISGVKIIKK